MRRPIPIDRGIPLTEWASKARDSILRLRQAKQGETTMQSRTLKQRYMPAIGLLLVGLLVLVAAGGGPARPDSRPNRTPHAALTNGGERVLAHVALTTAPPTATALPSPTSAPSATPTRAATLVPATPVTGASNALLAWGIVAALALVGLLNLLYNRRLRRSPPDTE